MYQYFKIVGAFKNYKDVMNGIELRSSAFEVI